MFRAKSLLDEILSGEAAGGMPATPQPVQSWFQAPQEVQGWNYNTETMEAPPAYLADTNLANVIAQKAQGMGYAGPMTSGGNTEADSSPGQWPRSDLIGVNMATNWLNQTGTDAANIYGNEAVRAWMDANGYDFGKYGDKTDMQNSNQGGEAYSGFSGPATDYMGIGKFLADKGLSAQHYNSGGMDNWRLVDGVGNEMVRGQYDTNDAGWFEKAVPLVIAAMGAGAAGYGSGLLGGGGAASGVGNGAFLGEGVASGIPAWDAAAGIGAEMAALPASQIGAMTPTLESMLPSVADAAAWESALPGMTPGMTVGGTVVDAALPSLASVAGSEAALPGMTVAESALPSIADVAAYESALPGMTPGMTVGGSIVESALPSVASVAASESALPGMIPGTTVGNPLNGLLGAAGGAADWLKANPIMGRLLMSGAGALVSGLGGSGGGSAASGSTNYGPAKQWNSPIQSGLLSAPRNVQQVQPGGLLGGPGVANSGAWQWRK